MVSGTYYWILSDVIVVVVVAFVALVIARCCLHEQMNRRQCTIHTIQFVLYESAMRLDSTGPREVQRYVCGRGESGVRRAKILREEQRYSEKRAKAHHHLGLQILKHQRHAHKRGQE